MAATLLLAALVIGPVSADTKSDLKQARQRLEVLVARMVDTRDRIALLGDQADALAARINVVQSRIAETRAAIDQVKAHIKDEQERAQATQEQLDERAKVAFQTGRAAGLEFVLGATSLSDLADRLAVVEAAAQSDRALIESIQAHQAALRTERSKLRALDQRLRGQRSELQRQHRELVRRLNEQKVLLQQLDEDRAEAEALVRRLEKKRKQEIAAERARLRALERQMAALASSGGVVPDGQPGPFYYCPVDEPRSFINDWGFPRYTGGYHPHQGNDIFAPYGTPIRAPFSGTAVDASNGIGGLAVSVYGAEGYVYNAHVSGIAQLGPVSTGEVIAYVGDSGNAQGGSPHDHFEWHPGNGGGVNPYPHLLEVCP